MKLDKQRLMELAGLNEEKVSMMSLPFAYPTTAFKEKAAELLDAMEIDMLDNYDNYDDWFEHGTSQPNQEVEEISGELVELDPTGGDKVDDWMEEVGYKYLEKNHKEEESVGSMKRLKGW